MIIPVGTGDFTSPKSSKLMVYQKSIIVTTCLFWQLKKVLKITSERELIPYIPGTLPTVRLFGREKPPKA